ncbi:protein twist-like isoform X2 [Anopheles albimanus]|uniref:Uncharacterized protein n=1 Tax=Anopheles albimanus TaxID=7167 RepID=A0A182F7Q0_ANOAL|nr:protein twist-like isoform X2 [Anopheles albimanus]
MYNKMSSFETASSDGDLCQPVCDPDPYYEANGGSYYTQLYPADSQNTGTQVITIMEEEGYWGSPCSSTNESQQADASLGPAHPGHHHRSSTAVSTIRLLSATHLTPLPPSCGDPSPSSCSSSSSSPSTSSSVSSSVYGHQQRHQLQPSLIGGYPCLRSPDADADRHQPHHPAHHHQQQHHQPHPPHTHHNHHQPSPVYDCPMVYEKNVNAYIADEGYYGGGNVTPMHVTSGGGTVLSMTGTTASDHHTSSSSASSSSSATSSSSSALLSSTVEAVPGTGVPIVRVVKRRNTANKKERRRTQSINSAYTSLRDRIPNVPNDTKLSKIKTLRLAISYIAHLLAVVNGNQDPSCDFRAELVPSSRKINAERRAQKSLLQSFPSNNGATGSEGRKIKGRTGWPQHVWALETKTSIK